MEGRLGPSTKLQMKESFCEHEFLHVRVNFHDCTCYGSGQVKVHLNRQPIWHPRSELLGGGRAYH
jgi:hypothetical protein